MEQIQKDQNSDYFDCYGTLNDYYSMTTLTMILLLFTIIATNGKNLCNYVRDGDKILPFNAYDCNDGKTLNSPGMDATCTHLKKFECFLRGILIIMVSIIAIVINFYRQWTKAAQSPHPICSKQHREKLTRGLCEPLPRISKKIIQTLVSPEGCVIFIKKKGMASQAVVETNTAISSDSGTIVTEQAVCAEGADKKHVCFCFVTFCFFSFVSYVLYLTFWIVYFVLCIFLFCFLLFYG